MAKDIVLENKYMKKEVELPIEEIVEKYKKGIIQTKIAAEYGVSQPTIASKIKKYYKRLDMEVPKTKNKGKKRIELPIKEIIDKYEHGISEQKLADEYNVAQQTISKRIIEYYKKEKRERPKVKYKNRTKSKKIKLPIEEMIKKYESGISSAELSREYNVSRSTILLKIRDYYKETSKKRIKHKTGQKRKELPIDEVIKKYEAGIKIKEMATEYNVSYNVIRTRISDYYKNNGTEKPKINLKRKQLPIKQIIKEYENGDKQSYLAKKYDVSLTTISERIREYYLENGVKVQRKKEIPIKEIIKKFESGIMEKELAKEYCVSMSTIHKKIHEYYSENKIRRKDFREKEIPILEVIEKYERGISELIMAKEYNVAYTTILRKIKKYYKESGKKEPKKLRSESVIVKYLKKGLTIEKILETASKKNVIIPQDIIINALNKVNNKNIRNDKEER